MGGWTLNCPRPLGNKARGVARRRSTSREGRRPSSPKSCPTSASARCSGAGGRRRRGRRARPWWRRLPRSGRCGEAAALLKSWLAGVLAGDVGLQAPPTLTAVFFFFRAKKPFGGFLFLTQLFLTESGESKLVREEKEKIKKKRTRRKWLLAKWPEGRGRCPSCCCYCSRMAAPPCCRSAVAGAPARGTLRRTRRVLALGRSQCSLRLGGGSRPRRSS